MAAIVMGVRASSDGYWSGEFGNYTLAFDSWTVFFQFVSGNRKTQESFPIFEKSIGPAPSNVPSDRAQVQPIDAYRYGDWVRRVESRLNLLQTNFYHRNLHQKLSSFICVIWCIEQPHRQ